MGRSSTKFGPLHLLCSLVNFVLAVGITILILWLIYRPKAIKVYVDSAALTTFNLAAAAAAAAAAATTLTYNLTLNISIRNPNNRASFYYDQIQAWARFNGTSFGLDDSRPAFFQHSKDTALVGLAFAGRASGLGPVAMRTFEREKREGYFHVEVKILAKLRLKVEFVKIGHFEPEVDCVVKIPVPSKNGSGFLLERIECDVDKF